MGYGSWILTEMVNMYKVCLKEDWFPKNVNQSSLHFIKCLVEKQHILCNTPVLPVYCIFTLLVTLSWCISDPLYSGSKLLKIAKEPSLEVPVFMFMPILKKTIFCMTLRHARWSCRLITRPFVQYLARWNVNLNKKYGVYFYGYMNCQSNSLSPK